MTGIEFRSTPITGRRVDPAVRQGAGVSEQDRIRIALGVTSNRAGIGSLMQAIDDAGDAERDIVVISPSGNPVVGKQVDVPEISFLEFDGETVIEAEIPVVESLRTARLRTQLKDFSQWMAPTLASRLRRHLQQDAVVAAVALYSSEEEQDVCRILLDYAVDYIYVQDAPH